MMHIAKLPVFVALLATLGGCIARSEVRGGSTSITREVAETATPGSTVTTTEHDPALPGAVRTIVRDTRPTVSRTERVTGTATGASGLAVGENVKQSADGTPPTLTLPGAGSGTGGGFSFDSSASFGSSWVRWALWIGGVLVAAFGAWKLKGGHIKQGPTLIGAGIVLFVGGFYPWALLALGLLVVAGYVFWHMDAGKRDSVRAELRGVESTMGKLTRAVFMSDPEVSNQLKATLDKLTTTTDDLRIAASRAREDIS